MTTEVYMIQAFKILANVSYPSLLKTPNISFTSWFSMVSAILSWAKSTVYRMALEKLDPVNNSPR